MIYLDYAANAPVDKEVLDTFYQANTTYFANPNSFHKLGLEANEALNEASNHILTTLGLKSNEIIFTSGASESNNLVIKGVCERYKNKGKHMILGAFEHNSITAPATTMQRNGFEIDIVPVSDNGIIDIDELKSMLRDDTILVSICSVDSELGIRQPIESIASLLKDYPNCIFHSDASQAIGKTDINYQDVDLITFTPHKFYGLQGYGALIKKKNIGLMPLIEGGRSTTIYRSGTPDVSGVIAIDKAVSLCIKEQEKRHIYVSELNKMIIDAFSSYPQVHINSNEYSIPYIINVSFNNIKSTLLIDKLEANDIYVSAKTSCCPKNTPSKIIYAYTRNRSYALNSMRISLSHLTSKEDIETFLTVFDACLKECNNGKI